MGISTKQSTFKKVAHNIFNRLVLFYYGGWSVVTSVVGHKNRYNRRKYYITYSEPVFLYTYYEINVIRIYQMNKNDVIFPLVIKLFF